MHYASIKSPGGVWRTSRRRCKYAKITLPYSPDAEVLEVYESAATSMPTGMNYENQDLPHRDSHQWMQRDGVQKSRTSQKRRGKTVYSHEEMKEHPMKFNTVLASVFVRLDDTAQGAKAKLLMEVIPFCTVLTAHLKTLKRTIWRSVEMR